MKALRIEIKQSQAHYRRAETVQNRLTYPLPPFSTVIGALHNACGFMSYQPMDISVQGKYGAMQREVYLNHTVLDRVEDDRTALLIKLKNSTMISTAYETAARGEKQNCSFLKERDIVVYDRAVLEEYKYFKQSEDKLPSCFAILTKSPQYYEVLYDVELVIYVRSSDAVLQKIQENIFNLTAIGRSEDFVDVISCEEAELEQSGEWQEKRYSMYISRELVDKEIIVLGNAVENMANGTMYALDKDYVIENKKRKFNKKWAFYTENYSVDEESWDYEGTDLYFDKKHNNIVNFM